MNFEIEISIKKKKTKELNNFIFKKLKKTMKKKYFNYFQF